MVPSSLILAAANATGTDPEEAFSFFKAQAASPNADVTGDPEAAYGDLMSYLSYKSKVGAEGNVVKDYFSGAPVSSAPPTSYRKESSLKAEVADLPTSGFSPEEVAANAAANAGQRPSPSTKSAGAGKNVEVPKSTFLSALLPDYIKAGDEVSAAAQATSDALGKNQGLYGEAVQRYINSIGIHGADEANVFLAQAAQESAKGVDAANLLNRLGLNSSDVDQEIGKKLAHIVDLTRQTDSMRADIVQRQSQIPEAYQNPIGWLVGNIALKGDINRHNQTLGQLQQEEEGIHGLTTAYAEVDAIQQSKYSSYKASESVARSKAALSGATQLASEQEVKAIALNAGYLTRNLEAYKVKFEVLQQRISFLERSANLDDRAMAKELQRQQEDLQLTAYNDVGRVLGYPPLPSYGVFKTLPPATKTQYETLLKNGGTKFGDDPLSAWELVSGGTVANMSPDMKAMVGAIGQIRQEKQSALMQNPEYRSMPIAKQKQELADEIYKEFNALQMNPTKNIGTRYSNPYGMPSVNTMLQDPEIAPTTLGRMLKTTLDKAPTTKMTDEQLVAMVKADLEKPDGVYQGNFQAAASDVAKYFSKVIEKNNTALHFDAWRLPQQDFYHIGNTNFNQYDKVVRALMPSMYNTSVQLQYLGQ